MEFEKLVSPSLKDLFITHIEAMILSGELPVGQQLPPERQLAQSMGVSRAVVNSGVAELERRGFLEVRPRVGTFVTDYRRAGTLDTLKSIMTYNRGRLRNEEIRSILEKVVSVGSGKNAAIEGYSIGGKTATSQTLPRSANRYISSFLGFFPAEDPQVLALCIIHDPKGIYYGGTIAAPVVRRIFENILPYMENLEKG